MCQDCPTWRSRTRAVVGELLADLLIPVVLYAIVAGSCLLVYYGPL